MSRSRKKKPVVTIVGGGNGKIFRRTAHKSMRAKVRTALAQGSFEDVPTRMEEVSDIYDYKDWSRYVTSEDSESLHKELQRQRRK